MKGIFKIIASPLKGKNIIVRQLYRDEIMTGYLSDEIHRKIRLLNKKRDYEQYTLY